MLRGVGPAVALGRDTTILREILDKAAERVGRDLTNEPEVEIELRNTLAATYGRMGLYQKEEEMACQSFEIARLHLGGEGTAAADATIRFAMALSRVGKLRGGGACAPGPADAQAAFG